MKNFYKGKKVLLTGHTGFKGSYLTKILYDFGADILGYSLEPTCNPNLFSILGLGNSINSIIGDIRDFDKLKSQFDKFNPEIVFHLAAQPLVLDSYKDPRYTYDTNVMGTVNILECIRLSDSVTRFLNVTTDKVYRNNEWVWGYRENEVLDGYDPYSNSKSCSELVTASYKRSFFHNNQVYISTARAGNVIGGGDYAVDRIIPDCVRAVLNRNDIIVRNPHSIRPYQHVLEPLYAYLRIASNDTSESYNVGPNEKDCVRTAELVDIFCDIWGNGAKWIDKSTKNAPHEANFLKLDATKIKTELGVKPLWGIKDAVEKIVEFEKSENKVAVIEKQINHYFNSVKES